MYGAALYVTHYICKYESQALKQVIAEQLASLYDNANHQETTAQEIGDLSLMIRTTLFCLRDE